MKPRLPALASLAVLAMLVAGCSGSTPSPTTTTPVVTVTQPPSPPPTVTLTQPPVIITQTPAPVTVTVEPTPTPTDDGGGDSTPSPSPSAPALGPAGDPPTVTGVSATVTGPTTADLKWTAKDDFGGLVSKASYGVTPQVNLNTPAQAGNGTFTVGVTGLASCTGYSFKASATDVGGQKAESAVLTFTTASGPAIDATVPTATNVLDNELAVTWTVTGPPDTVSWVNYGTTSTYNLKSTSKTGAGAQSVTLTGLTSNFDYHLSIHAQSPCGHADTTDKILHTALVVHVDINGRLPPYFSPNVVTVPKDTPLVFEIENKDTTTQHTWTILNMGYSTSGPLASGAKEKIHASISLPAKTPGYTMECTLHTEMQGQIQAS